MWSGGLGDGDVEAERVDLPVVVAQLAVGGQAGLVAAATPARDHPHPPGFPAMRTSPQTQWLTGPRSPQTPADASRRPRTVRGRGGKGAGKRPRAVASVRRGQHRGSEPGAHNLRAAAHPIDQRAAVDAVLVGEVQKLLTIDLSRQNLRRLVSLLRETQTTQGVSQPLSAVRHRYHRTCRHPPRLRGAMCPRYEENPAGTSTCGGVAMRSGSRCVIMAACRRAW